MNAAITYYRKIRSMAPRRSDLVANDIVTYSSRAIALTDEQRRAIRNDLARFIAGEVPCPKCGHHGPHRSNGHHRIGSIKFTCSGCDSVFKTSEIAA